MGKPTFVPYRKFYEVIWTFVTYAGMLRKPVGVVEMHSNTKRVLNVLGFCAAS
jgi:hypothetical protein